MALHVACNAMTVVSEVTRDQTLGLSWSGGKDSALALWMLRESEGRLPGALLSTVTADFERVSMHGVRRELLREQSRLAGVPLVEVEIPARCSNEVYEARMSEAFATPPLLETREMAFGDLFLQDIREYRESRLASAGRRACFPVWGIDTGELARRFIANGFRALLVCVDPRILDASFAGRELDERLLEDLPPNVDPCGENGEFHTFVYDGPIFSEPIACERGETVLRDGFVFCDVLGRGR